MWNILYYKPPLFFHCLSCFFLNSQLLWIAICCSCAFQISNTFQVRRKVKEIAGLLKVAEKEESLLEAMWEKGL